MPPGRMHLTAGRRQSRIFAAKLAATPVVLVAMLVSAVCSRLRLGVVIVFPFLWGVSVCNISTMGQAIAVDKWYKMSHYAD
jgi:hypothetical protein